MSHAICIMDPQRAMIYCNSMPRPEHIPALLLREPVLSSANPAKLATSPASAHQYTPVHTSAEEKAWPFPTSGHSTAILFYQQTSSKKSQSYPSPSSGQGALKQMPKLALTSAETAQVP